MKPNEQRLYSRTRAALDAASVAAGAHLTEADAVELARVIAGT